MCIPSYEILVARGPLLIGKSLSMKFTSVPVVLIAPSFLVGPRKIVYHKDFWGTVKCRGEGLTRPMPTVVRDAFPEGR